MEVSIALATEEGLGKHRSRCISSPVWASRKSLHPAAD